MPRTRQTARKSTGGKAPRRQLATAASCFGASQQGEASQGTLVSVYNSTKTRTIAVTGTDEFDVEVDEVTMSFKIMEEALDQQEAIVSALASLDEVRDTIRSLGVANESISSDALSVGQRVASMLNGEVVAEKSEDGSDDDDDEVPQGAFPTSFTTTRRRKRPKKLNTDITKVVVYQPFVILRVRLCGETVALFPRIMVTILQMGIPNYEPPVYDTSELTEHRNQARENAIVNAQEKAKIILEPLDSGVTVGKPVTVNDIHVDTYDIHQSDGSAGTHTPWYLHRATAAAAEPLKKSSIAKAKEKGFPDALLERVNELFVIPPIRITAEISCIFEIAEQDEKSTVDFSGDGDGDGDISGASAGASAGAAVVASEK